MGVFKKRSSVALTWSADGGCRGVCLRRRGGRCRVVGSWSSSPADSSSTVAAMADGVEALSPSENSVLVVGSADRACSFVDVEIPQLKSEDLRNALAYQVSKYAPVSAEDLVWGYRVLSGGTDSRICVRLGYMRRSEWDRWVEDARGIGRGIDMIIPPSMVLDPVLSDVPVYLGTGRPPGADSDDAAPGFVFEINEEGLREPARKRSPGEGVFGARPDPLDLQILDLGDLGELPAAEQQKYTAAVLLAMYGLTGELQADRKTWEPVPYEMRPHRHRQSRLAAAMLLIYLLVLGGYGLWQEFDEMNRYFSRLNGRISEVEAEIYELQQAQDNSVFMEDLSQELTDAYATRPSMASVLLELTRLIGDDNWVPQFDWDDGKVTVTVQISEEEDLGLFKTLEDSPLLGDIVRGDKNVRSGVTTRQIQLNARYDTDDELARAREALLKPVVTTPGGGKPGPAGSDDENMEPTRQE